jgi:hypothetical protein
VALDYCRECGDTVSTTATFCPHCGASDPSVDPSVKLRVQAQIRKEDALYQLFIAFIGLAFLASVLSTFAYLLRLW